MVMLVMLIGKCITIFISLFLMQNGSADPHLIQCLLCECNTMEQALKAHIQYNHMIYKEAVLQVRRSHK